MPQQKYYLYIGIFSLVCALLVFFIARVGALSFLSNGVGRLLYPLHSVVSVPLHLFTPSESVELSKIKTENLQLLHQLAQMNALEADNKALRDQFETTSIPPSTLLPAHIVGTPNGVPPLTLPEEIIIDAGKTSGVREGMVVVYKDNLVGQVIKTADYFSQVLLVSNIKLSFAGKDSNSGALGVIKGQGGGNVIFDTVLLSDTLSMGQLVVTAAGQDISGNGYPEGLVVGKIVGIDKDPSALFQKAKIALLFDIQKLHEVFVITR